jgi:hypothetical protein
MVAKMTMDNYMQQLVAHVVINSLVIKDKISSHDMYQHLQGSLCPCMVEEIKLNKFASSFF